MDPTESTVWEHLAAIHSGVLSLPAFEQWLYGTPEVETVLGPDTWLDLVSLDFRGRHATHEVRSFVERLYDTRRPGALPADEARVVARAFLAGSADLWVACRRLAALWYLGHHAWVPLDFVGLDSELDAIPAPSTRSLWEPSALARVLEHYRPWLEDAHRVARVAAVEMLTRLDSRETAI